MSEHHSYEDVLHSSHISHKTNQETTDHHGFSEEHKSSTTKAIDKETTSKSDHNLKKTEIKGILLGEKGIVISDMFENLSRIEKNCIDA